MKAINILQCLEEEPPPLDFVVPGLIGGVVGAIVSPGGTGKSFFGLQLGIQIACGIDTLEWGQRLINGKVAYLAAEDPEPVLQARLYALKEYLPQESRAALGDNLTIYTPNGGNDRIDLLSPSTEHGLLKIAEKHRLVIFDTLRRFHVADENDASAMSRVIAALEHIASQTGASVIFLHHTSKSAALNGGGDTQQASRGSSVLVDHVRWQAFLCAMSKNEAKENGISEECRRNFIRYGVSKQNYAPPIADLWLQRQVGGVLRTHRFEEQLEPSGRRTKAKKKDGF
jgi:RecA-family ATPase